jgi:hypothetical protein
VTNFEAMVTATNQKIDGLQTDLEETQDALLKVARSIEDLPKKYIPRTEAEIKADRVKKWIAGIVIGGVLLATTLGSMLYLNHGVTCGVRGILTSAQSSASRNPLPADLSDVQREYYEAQRARSRVFYKESLDRLNIIWPCAGESAP